MGAAGGSCPFPTMRVKREGPLLTGEQQFPAGPMSAHIGLSRSCIGVRSRRGDFQGRTACKSHPWNGLLLVLFLPIKKSMKTICQKRFHHMNSLVPTDLTALGMEGRGWVSDILTLRYRSPAGWSCPSPTVGVKRDGRTVLCWRDGDVRQGASFWTVKHRFFDFPPYASCIFW